MRYSVEVHIQYLQAVLHMASTTRFKYINLYVALIGRSDILWRAEVVRKTNLDSDPGLRALSMDGIGWLARLVRLLHLMQIGLRFGGRKEDHESVLWSSSVMLHHM